jgi:hypothetical protein
MAPDPEFLRDALRDLFALLDISATIQSATIGTGRAIVVQPLSLGDAGKLVHALDASPLTQVTPL